VRLADLVADANRYATKPLVLASPDLADLRLSGTFRIRDTRKLAENIGDLLGLAVVDRGSTFVLARSCPVNSQENCRPPS
jgi:transmembrane sensor